MRRIASCIVIASVCFVPTLCRAQAQKPNILVIFGDDIGTANVSAYSDGLMGYETPNIDRIAYVGLRFLLY
jgi:glycosylphosphatidylinositol transamidase (GPIT) subunit GPI8